MTVELTIQIINLSLIVKMMFWTLCFGLMKWRRHIMLNLVMLSHFMRLFEQIMKTLIHTLVSYSWLLKAFLKTIGKKPTLVLIDQDVTIKQTIENVFPNSKHRLCMQHIMKKLNNMVLF
uniref:MULE transposase domain-containing protein n=1 Tax=Lactuca sativa TaxID=4236 RepID=A0A9R1UVT4_LACSA|nr:hypothetical protein LSAT_V11C800439330 [Lactuca sativa]